MALKLVSVPYEQLNARQQENYNFLKASAVLADYGFMTMRLTADWQGADFIAQHIDGETFLKVQLKGRLSLDKKYEGKSLYVMFRFHSDWYLCPHDELMGKIVPGIKHTKAWDQDGSYHYPHLSIKMLETLKEYKIEQQLVPQVAFEASPRDINCPD